MEFPDHATSCRIHREDAIGARARDEDPVAALPELTLGRGGKVAIVTRSATPYDRDASVRLDGDVVDDLTAVLAALER